jgi:hypothetical protein
MKLPIRTYVFTSCQGHSRPDEAWSIYVLALTDARCQAPTCDVYQRVPIANFSYLSANLAQMRSTIAEYSQLYALSFSQLHCEGLNFRRFCSVEPRQHGVRHWARIFIEWRNSQCFASHDVDDPHHHSAQTSLTNRKEATSTRTRP